MNQIPVSISKSIISVEDIRHRKVFKKDGDKYLRVSEFFYDTIQGEGHFTGYPAAFLRLQGCTLDCDYCDTASVWKNGSPYTYTELFELMNPTLLIIKLRMGQHLIISGGSPLLQQEALVGFLEEFKTEYGFLPYIEIENECVIDPCLSLQLLVNCWNNSPKLEDSGMSTPKRYHPQVIKRMSQMENSWFKFVITKPEDWYEIEEDFLLPGLINKNQIILMPEGGTKKRLEKNMYAVVKTAVEHNVRYCSREQIILWSNKIGV